MKVLLLLLALARAAPDDAPEPGPPLSAAAPSFEDDLEAAKRAYFEGEHERSLDLLVALRARLDSGETVPDPIVADALIYLGEVQYQLGDRTASWDTFEDLLRRVPGASMSPLEHPTDVVRWFELVRDKVEQDPLPVPVPVPIGPPPPLPAWGYAPFGAPQIAMGRTARGVTYLTLQSGFAIVSIWSYVHLARINGEGHPPEWSDDEVVRRINLERWAVQWPATLGFYATWAVSVLDARRAWRADHAPPLAVGVAPRPSGALLVVRGRL